MSYPHRLNARVSAQQAQMQKHAEPNALFTGETSSGALSQSQLTFNRISRYVSYDKQTTILIFIWLLRQNPQQVCWLYYQLSKTLDIDTYQKSISASQNWRRISESFRYIWAFFATSSSSYESHFSCSESAQNGTGSRYVPCAHRTQCAGLTVDWNRCFDVSRPWSAIVSPDKTWFFLSMEEGKEWVREWV